MKTDFGEITGIQPLPVSFVTQLLAGSGTRGEFALPVDSLAFSEEDVKERMEVARAAQAVRATVNVSFGTWSPTTAFSSLATENILL